MIIYNQRYNAKVPEGIEDRKAYIVGGGIAGLASTLFLAEDTVAPSNRDTTDLGVFSVWQKLAARDEKFGHPEKFIGHIDQTKWMSFFPTIRDYPEFIERMEKKTGSKAGNGGIISFVDSSWDMSYPAS